VFVQATTALGDVVAPKDEVVSTEYRNQFAWPKDSTDSAPRKSISMGALKKAAVAEGKLTQLLPHKLTQLLPHKLTQLLPLAYSTSCS
jgi:hypothetical protein